MVIELGSTASGEATACSALEATLHLTGRAAPLLATVVRIPTPAANDATSAIQKLPNSQPIFSLSDLVHAVVFCGKDRRVEVAFCRARVFLNFLPQRSHLSGLRHLSSDGSNSPDEMNPHLWSVRFPTGSSITSTALEPSPAQGQRRKRLLWPSP